MTFALPEGEEYRGEILDTWQMTRTLVPEPVHNGTMIELEQRPYQAVVLRRTETSNAESK